MYHKPIPNNVENETPSTLIPEYIETVDNDSVISSSNESNEYSNIQDLFSIDDFLVNLNNKIDFSPCLNKNVNTPSNEISNVISNTYGNGSDSLVKCKEGNSLYPHNTDIIIPPGNDQQIEMNYLHSQSEVNENLSESGYSSDTSDNISSKCPSPMMSIDNDWDWLDSFTDLFPNLMEC